MALVTLSTTYYPDPTQGRPVFFGDIFIGDIDTDPEITANQKQVTLKLEDGSSLQVGQPLKTGAGGVVLYNGSPAQVTVDGDFSLKILNKAGTQVYYIPNNANLIDSSQVSQGSTTVDIAFDNLNVADYTELAAIPVAELENGDTTTLTDDLISGAAPKWKKVNSVAHGITTTSGNQVRIDDDNYWQRLYDDGNNFIDRYGGTDQENFDQAELENGSSEVLNFGPKSYTFNITVSDSVLRGFGNATIFNPSTTDPVITLTNHSGSHWQYQPLGGFTVDGGGDPAGVGAEHGITYDAASITAGGYNITDVYFVDCDSGYLKPVGNIGNSVSDSTFINCNIGVDLRGAVGMHCGAETHLRNHYDNMRLAVLKIDEIQDGAGGQTLRDCIAEGNPGFVVYCEFSNIVPVVIPTMDNFWTELNADGANIDFGDGKGSEVPREIRLYDTPAFLIKGSYIKSVELDNSMIRLSDCRVDNSGGATTPFFMGTDTDSMIIVDDLRMNGAVGGVPWVRSLTNQTGVSNTTNYSLRGPLRTTRIPVGNFDNATLVIGNSYSSAGPHGAWSGTPNVTPASVTDGVFGGPTGLCAELTIAAGNTVRSNPVVAPATTEWAVWCVHIKLVSGAISTMEIANAWTAGAVYSRLGSWQCTFGIQKVSSTGTTRMVMENTSGSPAVVRIADFVVATFPTKEEAMEIINNGIALQNEI
jgi:hypothetical protein